MGIRGLTSFIARDASRYMENIELQNTHLVVDGNCVASHLYKWCTKRDSAFGGDYDEYYVIVKNFFVLLKKCCITPIVLFDGGYEERKLNTVVTRLKTKLITLKTTFVHGFSSIKFFPLFMRQVFCEVLTSMGITIIQCEFEADAEIAALGRKLQCPILSYDSDFFVFDVLYIPFSTVNLEVAPKEKDKSFGLPCSIFSIDLFIKEHTGFQKCHLPILATLLGNDYVNSRTFCQFFHQIPLSKSKNISKTERKILGLIRWMSHESENDIIDKIKAVVGNNRFSEFTKAMQLTKDNYMPTCHCKIEERSGKLVVLPPAYTTQMDKGLIQLLIRCELPSFIINIVTLRKYFLPLQVEDIQSQSSHTAAVPIIQAIDGFLSPKSNVNLKLYLREKSMVKEREIGGSPLQVSDTAVEDTAELIRRQCIYYALRLDEDEQACVETFLNESQLFFASLISWCKYLKPSAYHAQALLLGYLACQAKNQVGYMQIGKEGEFSREQVITVTKIFAPYRKTSESSRESFNISSVHVFNAFQSILYHCSVLNVLFNNPFKPCRVADFYSGTLLYNICSAIESKNDILKTLLSPIEHFYQLYENLNDRLCRFFPAVKNSMRTEKRRRKKKTKVDSDSDLNSEFNQDTEPFSQVDYSDICNKFYLLST